MNAGMISGCVVRVIDYSDRVGFPAAEVTVCGVTPRPGAKDLMFFEQVRLRGTAAKQALSLKAGECVLFDRASVEQDTWTDPPSGEARSKILIRATGLVRVSARPVKRGEYLTLEGALNIFTVRGRLVADASTKQRGVFGQVTEGTVAVNLPNESRPHYLPVEGWRESGLSGLKKGAMIVAQSLVKTDSALIAGEKRHFTKLEALQVTALT